jgi:hypothetical protein
VAGLVAACEDRRRRGRGAGPGGELAALRRECARLRRECARQQALARATRRTVGLTTAPAPPPEGAGKRRKRRPSARALKLAALLCANADQPGEPAAATGTPPEAAPPAP